MNKAEYLLNCSITYKNSSLRSEEIPSEFETEYDAKKTMLEVLMHEAKETFDSAIHQPETLSYCPVDLESDKPGIYKEEKEVIRKSGPFPKIHYSINPGAVQTKKYKTPPVEPIKPKKYPKTVEEAQEKSTKEYVKNLEKQERRAFKELEREEEKQEKKRLLEQETPEQKEARLKEQREKRAQKKREREEKGEPEKKEKKERKPKPLPEEVEPACDQVLPPPPKRVSGKMQYYECPIPHDRHMYALERCDLNEDMSQVLLKNKPNESVVKVVQGPPGTGKSSFLLEMIKKTSGRILCCAPTNVGAADLYTRCLKLGIRDCSLILPPDRIPKDTILMSENPEERIVCCTISGRNGRMLENQEFESVFLDEAGQCMEAHVWGLLRHSVQFLCMTGDIRQLPAQTSESGKILGHNRSLMQRLLEQGYPSTTLTKQRRMHPEISKFPNQEFYNGELEDVDVDKSVKKPYQVMQVDGKEVEDKTSYSNSKEVEVCVSLVEKLSSEYGNIVVITPYSAQCRLLLSNKLGVPIHTIDSFQGKEADCVIVSMVRTGSDVGFWSDSRRLTVALTRAKYKLVIVGNAKSWKTEPLVKFSQDAKLRNVLVAPK